MNLLVDFRQALPNSIFLQLKVALLIEKAVKTWEVRHCAFFRNGNEGGILPRRPIDCGNDENQGRSRISRYWDVCNSLAIWAALFADSRNTLFPVSR